MCVHECTDQAYIRDNNNKKNDDDDEQRPCSAVVLQAFLHFYFLNYKHLVSLYVGNQNIWTAFVYVFDSMH